MLAVLVGKKNNSHTFLLLLLLFPFLSFRLSYSEEGLLERISTDDASFVSLVHDAGGDGRLLARVGETAEEEDDLKGRVVVCDVRP